MYVTESIKERLLDFSTSGGSWGVHVPTLPPNYLCDLEEVSLLLRVSASFLRSEETDMTNPELENAN